MLRRRAGEEWKARTNRSLFLPLFVPAIRTFLWHSAEVRHDDVRSRFVPKMTSSSNWMIGSKSRVYIWKNSLTSKQIIVEVDFFTGIDYDIVFSIVPLSRSPSSSIKGLRCRVIISFGSTLPRLVHGNQKRIDARFRADLRSTLRDHSFSSQTAY